MPSVVTVVSEQNENSVSLAQRLAEKFAAFHDVIGEIREQLHRYRHVAKVSPMPTALISRQGHNVYTNSAYHQMLECSPDELLDQGWEQFTHPDDLPAVRKNWFAFVNNSENHFRCGMRFVTKVSKHTLPVTVAAARIPGDGFVAYIIPCDGCSQMERWLPKPEATQQLHE